MARRTPPEENIPLIVFKPFVWRSAPPPQKPPAPTPSNIPVMTAAEPARPVFNLRDTSYDGYLIGRSGDERPGTPLSQIRGVLPQPPAGPATQKIIYVNGIRNSVNEHYDSLQAIANNANAEVVGVYNATEGWLKDFAQCVMDKAGIGHNPAVETLKNTLYAELTSGSQQPINLMAHSQGALITSRALGDVRKLLEHDGLSSKEIDARLSRLHIDTFGGAAETYPNGPHYNHYVNVVDPVPLVGQNSLVPQPGAGAQVHMFRAMAANPHDFTDVYLKHRESDFPRDAQQ